MNVSTVVLCILLACTLYMFSIQISASEYKIHVGRKMGTVVIQAMYRVKTLPESEKPVFTTQSTHIVTQNHY